MAVALATDVWKSFWKWRSVIRAIYLRVERIWKWRGCSWI